MSFFDIARTFVKTLIFFNDFSLYKCILNTMNKLNIKSYFTRIDPKLKFQIQTTTNKFFEPFFDKKNIETF